MPTPEAAARADIDRPLAAARWVVPDAKAMHVAAGRGVAVREFPLAEWARAEPLSLPLVNGKAHPPSRRPASLLDESAKRRLPLEPIYFLAPEG